ncbi:hypothetical protein GW17_00019968 [Ensete ventricosum]|nr:hypothetical protein GW17_00019968 [Ensete ventricosum]
MHDARGSWDYARSYVTSAKDTTILKVKTRSSVKMRPHQPNPSCRSKSREAHVVRPISIQRLLTPQLRVYAVGVSWALPSLRRSLLRIVNEITKQSPYSPPADRICLPLDRGIIVLSSIMQQYEHKFDRV